MSIDWSKAPEGATHWHDDVSAWYKIVDDSVFIYSDYDDVWVLSAYEISDFSQDFITHPESITDVARSIEAARQVEKDAVNNPSHYTTGGIECIDAMQAMLSRDEFIGYLRGNVFKYQWRYQHKNGVEDLKKARWYANRLIELESGK